MGLRPLAYWDCGFETARFQDVSFECCVLSGRGLCDRSIPRPEQSYGVCVCVCVCVCVSVSVSVCHTELSRARIALYSYNEYVGKNQNKKKER